MQEFEGRTAFITGGASGIGLAMAKTFASLGMNVAIADVEQAALDAAVEELSCGNTEVMGVLLDVRDREAMDRCAADVRERFGKVHILCNNAGVGAGGPLQEVTHDDWDWVIGVNLQGVVNGLQSFLADMVAHGEPAHVVNTASLAGIFGGPGMGIYSATKFAVVGMSQSMVPDLEGTEVGVSVLCPGFVKTNIYDSGRNRPEDLPGKPRELTEEQQEMMAMVQEGAMPVERVAELVLDAIREDRFWIFTHPEFKESIQSQMKAMLDAMPDP